MGVPGKDAKQCWHVVVLRPTTERRQPQDRLLVTLLFQPSCGILHQQRVAVVHRIAKLEDEDSVRIKLLELLLKLEGGKAPLVHAIVVRDAVKNFNLSSNKPFAAFENPM